MMGSLTASGSRATQIFSRRGQSALVHGSRIILWDITSNVWHKETNSDGYVNVGVAENTLLHDILLDYIHANIRLTANYITYNDGSMGSNRLRQAVSHFMNRHLNPVLPVEPQQIVITNGCSSAIEQLSWAFMEPGEGILLGKPYYGTFIADLSLRPGAVVVPVDFGDIDPLGPQAVSQYERAAMEFERRTGKRVRAFMLCHPHNPLGRCYPRSVIADLMRMCQARQLHLISDEIYAMSVWDNRVDTDVPPTRFESVLSVDTAGLIDPDLVHIIWGMSKDFGANGLRLGAIVSQSSPELQMALKAMSLYSYVSGLSDQITSSLLLDDAFTDRYIQLNRERLSEAHAFFVQLLWKYDIEYIRGCNAGFFVWINLGKKYLEANPGKAVGGGTALTDMIMQKLLDKKVFLASGTSFGSEKPGWFRVVFAHPLPYLEEAMKRILLAVGPEV
ncbi:putative aminotransferase, classes I and II family [Aspergillus fischeri NRRL 181]|uniref:Acc synthase n=1 Tax=Neosartorya fischeri (strain ATCC 1020 / DSM 3700 / CBS 544.65 / FGSC A1164 / JCM 1740 / NRRL 181 / WB 181) TaxID=331117 RepID=A1DLI5_NEOFI|nr:acc synthase [Aspergillus fischeri NRRL 181]EAW15656.1 acc synthase [Aspergillus fischeri NRRL 181]